jgi:hypothetical protein
MGIPQFLFSVMRFTIWCDRIEGSQQKGYPLRFVEIREIRVILPNPPLHGYGLVA